MSKYLEMVKLNAILAGELNKFEGIDARIAGAHTILATYKGVDVRVEVISTEKTSWPKSLSKSAGGRASLTKKPHTTGRLT